MLFTAGLVHNTEPHSTAYSRELLNSVECGALSGWTAVSKVNRGPYRQLKVTFNALDTRSKLVRLMVHAQLASWLGRARILAQSPSQSWKVGTVRLLVVLRDCSCVFPPI